MPSMFQSAVAKAHPSHGHAPAQLPADADDGDIALGCESAYPWLQFEGWEPQAPEVPVLRDLHY